MTRIVRKLAALAAVLTIAAASVPAAEYMPVTLSVSASAAGAELTADDVSQFKRDWRNHDYVLKKGLWANNMQSGINCIKDAQRMLNYILGDSLDVDGGFGSATKASTIKFQRRYSLDDDGIIGTGTWNRMIEVVEGKISSSGGSQQTLNRRPRQGPLRPWLLRRILCVLRIRPAAQSRYRHRIPAHAVRRRARGAQQRLRHILQLPREEL